VSTCNVYNSPSPLTFSHTQYITFFLSLCFLISERFSFILFTPDAYNVLLPTVRDEVRRLGFTAASSSGEDDVYFSQFRDLGKVDEASFDKLMDARKAAVPPPFGPG